MLPIVCGTNRLGKTKSSKAALSLVGNGSNFFSAVRQRFIPRLCSRSTLPPVLDDVKSPTVIENVAVSFYNSGKDGTCVFEAAPRTIPMFTVNWDTLEGLNNDPRVLGRLVLIPFQEGTRSPLGIENQQNAEFQNNAIMERGSSAFGTMVAISRSVEYLCITRTNELCQQFTIEAPNIDDRCLRNHALLVAFAEKVIRLANIDDLYPSNAIAFFKQTILPVWMKRFQTNQAQVSHAMLQTEQPIIVDLIIKSIEHKISCKNLLTCVNPK
ncbi:uncharacterized protein LOC124452001 [Xenia sp. Carnegie-2017]|uniref:uncharacterized protein LOC124452001 n=1 Tax=Xenia sp. Carnegie-2017 TaxID=2897299 RepID=UPI001F049FA5|nr:uncharacterized protein LOC124452001 [Xenia sp. Carnegie-2017]